MSSPLPVLGGGRGSCEKTQPDQSKAWDLIQSDSSVTQEPHEEVRVGRNTLEIFLNSGFDEERRVLGTRPGPGVWSKGNELGDVARPTAQPPLCPSPSETGHEEAPLTCSSCDLRQGESEGPVLAL